MFIEALNLLLEDCVLGVVQGEEEGAIVWASV